MPEDLSGPVVTPEFGRQALADIAGLNERFIELLLERAGADTALGMRRDQVRQLTALRPAARRRLTQCAVTLFDLRLDDDRFWIAARERRTAPGNDTDVQLFTLCALMYLRHLATITRFLACLSFCVSDEELERFVALPIAALPRIARAQPPVLTSRLGDDGSAWRDLVRLARRIDGRTLVPARLLGMHHAQRD